MPIAIHKSKADKPWLSSFIDEVRHLDVGSADRYFEIGRLTRMTLAYQIEEVGISYWVRWCYKTGSPIKSYHCTDKLSAMAAAAAILDEAGVE